MLPSEASQPSLFRLAFIRWFCRVFAGKLSVTPDAWYGKINGRMIIFRERAHVDR